ncbi:pilus assembly protein PilP [Catenovulum agarivorans]|uniref:pilus assembly protein PilP n=1 Tax=Catenovulum agarivorans TaxID=1172192 RepID=UPI00031B0DDE|nr:pilus assembly protein PilP [Catenovulum agarivorans]
MRILALLGLVVTVAACSDDVSDLQAFTEQVKNTTQPSIEPIPQVEKFESFEYSVSGMRSPFVEPEPELIEDKLGQTLDCLQPNYRRTKEPLEKFALDNIRMRGTMGGEDKIYALASASNGSLYRIGIGNYLGLFHGRVVKITPDYIQIEEMVPDGTGCWDIRKAEITILDAETDAGSKQK